jgi:hypothetical protein
MYEAMGIIVRVLMIRMAKQKKYIQDDIGREKYLIGHILSLIEHSYEK